MSIDSATAVDVANLLHGPTALVVASPFLLLVEVYLARWWGLRLNEAYMTWSILALLGSMFCGMVVYGVSIRMVQASFESDFALAPYFTAAAGFILGQHALLLLAVGLFAVMVLRNHNTTWVHLWPGKNRGQAIEQAAANAPRTSAEPASSETGRTGKSHTP